MSRAWMPMYWGDYLRDTRDLTAEEHGAYLMLIAHYWNRGPLPDDQEALCRVSRVGPKRWPRVWKTISRFFDLKPLLVPLISHGPEANGKQMLSNCWCHKRIDEEIKKAEIIRHNRQISGRIGGLRRGNKSSMSRIVSEAIAKQTDNQSQSHTESLPSVAEPRPQESGLPRKEARQVGLSLEDIVRAKGWAP
jgi:uncharacterized protein YdaU (DUF1376 family)